MRSRGLLSLAAVVAALACGDPYLHTNPYDPAFPVVVTVTGPDTLFSYTEIGQFAATATPAFPDSAMQFASSDSLSFQPAGFAAFEAGPRNGPPLWPETHTVTVSAGVGAFDTVSVTGGNDAQGRAFTIKAWRHSGFKQVVLTQRVVRIALRCPDTHACDTLSVGGSWSVWADGFDALSHKIFALTSATANPSTGDAIATFVSRDPTIASLTPVGIRVAAVTALKTGTTWIVATRGSLLDSLQLVVR